ncbi:MAG TPA: class I SAM-dependent methyltransferase [Xanthobacteraceae bacterium]|nr:class I SAM-dependent methyltransferase [Xanthobacteraceae bacterium]
MNIRNDVKGTKRSGEARVRGKVVFKHGRLSGWVLGAAGETLEIAAIDATSGTVIWQGMADDLRQHSRNPNKNCGFRITVPGKYVRAGARIKFIDQGTSQELPFSPHVFGEEYADYVDRLNALSHWPFLHFSAVMQKGAEIVSRVIAVTGGESNERPKLLVQNADGISAITAEEMSPDPSIHHSYWYAPAWPHTRFSVNLTRYFSNPLRDESGVPFVQLGMGSAADLNSISRTRVVGLVPVESVKLPPDVNVRRVQAHGDAEQKFTGIGFSHYRTYRAVFEQHGGKRWSDLEKVLDWGCGCGRVTQHLMQNLGSEKVYGVDIDGDNINWCLANLSTNFAKCELTPPLPYPDNTFDYIIGTSVFTHIQEALQGRWLEDLRRILAPGGLAAVTVGTDTRIAFGSYEPDRLQFVSQAGIEDTIPNSQLNDVIDDSDYYRNVRMSKDYIREKWNPYFEILDIIDHAIGVQDIVVCRKR